MALCMMMQLLTAFWIGIAVPMHIWQCKVMQFSIALERLWTGAAVIGMHARQQQVLQSKCRTWSGRLHHHHTVAVQAEHHSILSCSLTPDR